MADFRFTVTDAFTLQRALDYSGWDFDNVQKLKQKKSRELLADVREVLRGFKQFEHVQGSLGRYPLLGDIAHGLMQEISAALKQAGFTTQDVKQLCWHGKILFELRCCLHGVNRMVDRRHIIRTNSTQAIDAVIEKLQSRFVCYSEAKIVGRHLSQSGCEVYWNRDRYQVLDTDDLPRPERFNGTDTEEVFQFFEKRGGLPVSFFSLLYNHPYLFPRQEMRFSYKDQCCVAFTGSVFYVDNDPQPQCLIYDVGSIDFDLIYFHELRNSKAIVPIYRIP